MSQPLRIYTETPPEGRNPTFMLWPFFPHPPEDRADPDSGRFDNYLQQANTIITLTDSLAECDLVLLPFDYDPNQPGGSELAQKAAAHRKPFVVFYNSDFDDDVPFANASVFRTTAYCSLRGKNVHGFPGWSIDFLCYTNGEFTPIPKAGKPRISYCGYVDYLSASERLRYLWKRRNVQPMYRTGPELRGKAVRRLQKDSRIETDFIIRGGFWAAGISDKHAARKVYIENILASPYALVARGAGNFSYRLYEVLSCGRIPVFIDTDCVLPFDEFIDWHSYGVWLDSSAVNDLPERLLAFHQQISPAEFELQQLRCRKLYEDYIRPEAFFRAIALYFRKE